MRFFNLLILSLHSCMVIAGQINYEGSSTIGKLISDATKVYKASEFKINTVSESLGGEQCVVRNQCDLGGVARNVDKKFIDQGVVSTLIGKDAIAAIVNVANPVKELSSEQLKKIFTGAIKNWSQVGGENWPIRPLVVKSSSATREVFGQIILGQEAYHDVEVITPDAQIATTVAKDKRAIGQLSLAFIIHNSSVRPLKIDHQEANVDNPHYPITRPLYFVTRGTPQGEVKTFLEWVRSPEGQKVVKQRFVGIRNDLRSNP